MAALGTNSPSPILLELEKLLISDIRDSELWSQLAQKLSEYQVLLREVSSIFPSLDPDRQGKKLRERYLLRSVVEKMESEDQVYYKFIEVFSELNLHPLSAKLTVLKCSTSPALPDPRSAERTEGLGTWPYQICSGGIWKVVSVPPPLYLNFYRKLAMIAKPRVGKGG